jgi:hypothetical protein
LKRLKRLEPLEPVPHWNHWNEFPYWNGWNRLGDVQRFESFDVAQDRLREAMERLERLEQIFYLITPAFGYSFDPLVLGLQFFSRSEFLESFLHQVLCAHFFDGRDIVTEPANLLLIR